MQQCYKTQGEQVDIEELLELAQYLHPAIVSVANTLTHELGHGLEALATTDLRDWIEVIGRCPAGSATMARGFDEHIRDWRELDRT